MKQYVCIKDYVTAEGEVAFKKGKIYDLTSNGMLYSELADVKYYLTQQFKKVNFKKHKPMKSFGGKGIFDPNLSTWKGMTITPLVVDRINGDWVQDNTTLKADGKEVMRIDANGNIVDSVVQAVVKKFQDRSRVGIEKYNTTLDRTDLKTLDWINHAQEEAMDFCLYLERLKKELC